MSDPVPGPTPLSLTGMRASGRRDAAVVRFSPEPPQTVFVVPDPPSVVVVEAFAEPGQRLDNPVAIEPGGEDRLRLVPPDVGGEPLWRLGFSAVFADPFGLGRGVRDHRGLLLGQAGSGDR